MATLQDLLDKVNSNYTVVSLEDKGTTAGGKIREYDLWYDDNGIVRYKRLHIYDDGTVAKWYSENPIPTQSQPIETFADKVRNKIKNVLSKNVNVKHVKLGDVDDSLGRATLTVWVDDNGTVTKKDAVVYKKADGTLGFEIL